MSVDAHCHVDLHRDPASVVRSAVISGLKIVAVTTTPAAFKGSSRFSDVSNGVWPALGMHPEVVGTRRKDVALFAKYVEEVDWVGEIGLDGSARFRGFWDDQVAVLEQVLGVCSEVGGKVLSIHSRAASAKVIELLSQFPDAGIPVFHWFSGQIAEVDAALRMGAFFSVNYQMLRTASGKAIARRIPLDRLLTESDAPFAAWDNKSVVEQIHACEQELASILKCSQVHVVKTVSENFENLSAQKR